VQTRLLLGRAFLTRGDVSQAIAQLQQARSMDPSNPDVLGGLSDALLAARQSDRAADGYRAYLALRPDDAAATLNLGIALAESGRVREATAVFERAHDLNPGDPRVSKNLASLALNANDIDSAGRAASEAVRLAPADPEAHDLLGRALAGRAQLDAARLEFERALALNPNYAQARDDLQTLARAFR
jgi:Flp pilus assembly protein TadD